MNSKKSAPVLQQLTIGEVALRTGLSVSAIRFYEEKGLVIAGRNKGAKDVSHAPTYAACPSS